MGLLGILAGLWFSFCAPWGSYASPGGSFASPWGSFGGPRGSLGIPWESLGGPLELLGCEGMRWDTTMLLLGKIEVLGMAGFLNVRFAW